MTRGRRPGVADVARRQAIPLHSPERELLARVDAHGCDDL
jgi:hypothetical protein